MIHGTTSHDPQLELVVFQWSKRLGNCYECGLPAAFWIPRPAGPWDHAEKRDENGVLPSEKRCAVCAANAAAEGYRVARIEEEG